MSARPDEKAADVTAEEHALCLRLLEEERERVATLEGYIAEKSNSLFLVQRNLEEAHAFVQGVLSALPNAVIVLDVAERIVDANERAFGLSGTTRAELVERPLEDLVRLPSGERTDRLLSGRGVEAMLLAKTGEEVPVLFHAASLSTDGAVAGFVCIATDLRERQAMESKLREASRLESVGQLAAGVAHELNTPIQFVSDSVHFLSDAFEDLERVRRTTQDAILDRLDVNPRFAKALAQIEAIRSETDFDFLVEEIPEAVRRCRVGTERVSAIVRAMKRFTHPGSERMTLDDVNEVLDAAAIMGRSEYKYCAEIELDLQTVPPIPLDVGQLNQAVLNLVVNAAHAIQDRHYEQGEGTLGTIRVASRVDGDHVLVEVEDDGAGIPPEVRDRIFEPFFTTKVVGQGTGQGLAQVWGAIVERHKGAIEVHSEPGRGTRFELRLPMRPGDST